MGLLDRDESGGRFDHRALAEDWRRFGHSGSRLYFPDAGAGDQEPLAAGDDDAFEARGQELAAEPPGHQPSAEGHPRAANPGGDGLGRRLADFAARVEADVAAAAARAFPAVDPGFAAFVDHLAAKGEGAEDDP